MDLSKGFEIIKFSRSLPSNKLENLYKLNQENTPEVGSIESYESFVSLLDISSIIEEWALEPESINILMG